MCLFASGAPAPQAVSWAGKYQFDEFCPPNQTRVYELTISNATTEPNAKLSVDGFQIAVRARATAVRKGNRCQLVYTGTYVDKDLAMEPFPKFGPGKILLTLERKNGKLITRWGELQPLLTANQKPGVYFKRSK